MRQSTLNGVVAHHLRAGLALVTVALLGAVWSADAAAEQAAQPQSAAAAQLDVSAGTSDGSGHSCRLFGAADVRCWGFGGNGRLGYANTATIGDDETPGSAGPIELFAGGTPLAISAGAFHTCALSGGGSVRCWGFGGDGRLGYGSTDTIGDDQAPRAVGPVDFGPGRSAVAISAGGGHSCAVLDNGSVQCWGFGGDGRLGYGNRRAVGDDEPPRAVDPVDFGPDRSALAISAGRDHTCALLDDGSVRCWGLGNDGRLGYGNTTTIGDDETPASAGPVDLGAGRRATALSAGHGHTCAVLDDGSVRCWGYGANGRLGYGNNNNVGDAQRPGSAGPVQLGPGRTAQAISAGDAHTCALLDDASVRCWGLAQHGRLGYPGAGDVGDDEAPGTLGAVDLGSDGGAAAVSAGGRHTCARLENGAVRCWGNGFTGRLGYCNERDIGDDETPGSAGPVNATTAVDCRPVQPPAPQLPVQPAPQLPVQPAPPPAHGRLSTAKLELARATIVRRDRVLDVLARITRGASGRVHVELQSAGRRYRFTAPVDAHRGRIRFRRRIPRAQADLGTGILTIVYRGDADTRPQTVRLRAASQRAALRPRRPTIEDGRLRAAGTVSRRARGAVRVQLEYVVAGRTTTLQFPAPISNGRWSLNQRLSQSVRDAIATRTGTAHSYTLFTGYARARIRGEMRSFQVLAEL